ncbi:tRNA-dihydrouridine synthase family protein [Phragmitibacter flavus]|uniref:tRNA-dihydrouridine synthase n=2 Tax=Phragmitibacter flavus TaxID=2576071 RepID=A0A5R8KAS1_9BACT|nr:tRNA-dihydrouridine synthase family protein [Phragmitibacter flavus]
MQDVTDWPFWKLIQGYGGADFYVTEYFRVHADSRLEKDILRSVVENPTGRPVVAQMIGNDVPSLVRTAKELQQSSAVAIDLNLGCPAPIVYKKCAGGGLLRDLALVDRILGALREAVTVKLTVKTRIGFDDPAVFEDLLPILNRHEIDLLTVHGRTVKEMYRSEVHYDFIARAVEVMSCPVIANGNVYSAQKASEVLDLTGAAGLMIGRGAIRNPWMFRQIREHLGGESVYLPSGREVLRYVEALYEAVTSDAVAELYRVQKMKKYLNFIGLGIEPTGSFLHAMRRVTTREAMMGLCAQFLDHDEPMALEPYEPELKEQDVLAGSHR